MHESLVELTYRTRTLSDVAAADNRLTDFCSGSSEKLMQRNENEKNIPFQYLLPYRLAGIAEAIIILASENTNKHVGVYENGSVVYGEWALPRTTSFSKVEGQKFAISSLLKPRIETYSGLAIKASWAKRGVAQSHLVAIPDIGSVSMLLKSEPWKARAQLPYFALEQWDNFLLKKVDPFFNEGHALLYLSAVNSMVRLAYAASAGVQAPEMSSPIIDGI